MMALNAALVKALLVLAITQWCKHGDRPTAACQQNAYQCMARASWDAGSLDTCLGVNK